MIITRATLESEDGFMQTKIAVAAPETFCEYLHLLLFRPGYHVGESTANTPYPVFEKEIAIKASGTTRHRSFTLRPVRQEGYSVE